MTTYLPFPSVFPISLITATAAYREVGSPLVGADVTAMVRSRFLDAAFRTERCC